MPAPPPRSRRPPAGAPPSTCLEMPACSTMLQQESRRAEGDMGQTCPGCAPPLPPATARSFRLRAAPRPLQRGPLQGQALRLMAGTEGALKGARAGPWRQARTLGQRTTSSAQGMCVAALPDNLCEVQRRPRCMLRFKRTETHLRPYTTLCHPLPPARPNGLRRTALRRAAAVVRPSASAGICLSYAFPMHELSE